MHSLLTPTELAEMVRSQLTNASATAPDAAGSRPIFGVIWAQAAGQAAGWQQQAGGGAIGLAGAMPWHLPADLRWFQTITRGYPVIMGRRTWESLPAQYRPLPGRKNIVITSAAAKQSRTGQLLTDSNQQYAGAILAPTLQAALIQCADAPCWVIGGGAVYREALPHASLAVITQIQLSVPQADTHAPILPAEKWRLTAATPVRPEPLPHTFTLWNPVF